MRKIVKNKKNKKSCFLKAFRNEERRRQKINLSAVYFYKKLPCIGHGMCYTGFTERGIRGAAHALWLSEALIARLAPSCFGEGAPYALSMLRKRTSSDTRNSLGMRLVWGLWDSETTHDSESFAKHITDHVSAFLRLSCRSIRNVERSEKGVGADCA